MSLKPLFCLFLSAGLILSHFASAQNRCGTVLHNKQAENTARFEQWLQARTALRQQGQQRTQAAPYKVPVVVHIVHKGEAEGTGTNLSEAQVRSQIRVLNEDFKRLNADAALTSPTFTGVAGTMDIAFVLARQDPEGLPSSGIVRVKGSQNEWTMNNNYTLKAQSYWPAEYYLNIWVCDLTDYLGYTQFPLSNLPGLENGSINAKTDGIVVWYRTFGSIDDNPSFSLHSRYNKGRTLTHEMGHFLGLRHIWGDDDGACTGTDYVADTPNQAGSSSTCTTPYTAQSDNCISEKMLQNFMDYTDDGCMNLFSQAQVTRMSTVIETSIRRASLLTSPALNAPVPVPNDLGIRTFISPGPAHCTSSLTPAIEVRNYGNNPITSAQISLSMNGTHIETKNVTLNLTGYLQTTVVTFNPTAITPGPSTLSANILLTNGTADGNSFNNTRSTNVLVPVTITAPFAENFDVLPPQWVIQNPDLQTTWQLRIAPTETSTNRALQLNFFDYEEAYGEQDILLSPVFDLSSVPAALLKFDVAYAQFQGRNDQLKVIVLKDCEALAAGTIVYDKAGAALATAPRASQAFSPGGKGHWRQEYINLTAFIGQQHVQLAFVGVNDWGNNLYLDNISVSTSKDGDLLMKRLISPGYVTCNTSISPVIGVQNVGFDTVTGFKVEYSVNNASPRIHTVSNLSLTSGSEMEIVLPAVSLQDGNNTLSVTLLEPNGIADPTPANNLKTFPLMVNQAADRIPLRQNFEQPFAEQWAIINPGQGMNWQSIKTNYGTSLYFNAFNNTTIGDEAWLVSPALDFSKTTIAWLVLDVSYSRRGPRQETLRVLASADCGYTYNDMGDIALADFQSSTTSWTPITATDWQNKVTLDLSPLAGSEDVRIALVASSTNGNNLYVDNLEVFVTPDPYAVEVNTRYAIYGYDKEVPAQSNLKITFNLAERQDVPFSIVDMMGKSLVSGVLPDVLNQTYPLALPTSAGEGIYLVRMKIGNRYYAERVQVFR